MDKRVVGLHVTFESYEEFEEWVERFVRYVELRTEEARARRSDKPS